MGMRYSYLDTIDFYKVLKDKELSSTDKVIFLYIALKKNETLKEKFTIYFSEASNAINIPENIIKYSINNKLSKYINRHFIPKLVKIGGLRNASNNKKEK